MMDRSYVLSWVIFLVTMKSAVGFDILCHHSDGTFGDAANARARSEEHQRGLLSDDGRYIRCNKTSRDMVCFALWRRTANGTTILKQSCMRMSDDYCQQPACSHSFYNNESKLEYCCCKGRLCNTNVHLAVTVQQPRSVLRIPDYDDDAGEEEEPSERHMGFTSGHLAAVLGVSASVVLLAFAAAIAVLVLRRRQAARKALGGRPLRLRKSNSNSHANGRLASASEDSCGTASTRLVSQNGARQRFSQGKLLGDFSRLQLLDLIHRGKYGEVWRGCIPAIDGSAEDGEGVYCVKTFSRGPQQQYFQNERDIYSMPMNCNHPNILACLGWDMRPGDGLAMLVLEYCPYGSLQHHLANNSIDWRTFLRLSMGAAAGLAHLHSEFGVAGVTRHLTQEVTWTTGDRKCPIVHRDVNSRNMVVRQDGTVMISDMGFAVKLAPGGNRYYNRDNEPENAEENPLQEVGTVRYMAPEVLEGFVNLRECESSLKQVDVYALALVLWELCIRCHALFRSGEALQYMEPYWTEVGPQPDVSVLTETVVKQKVRPKFPDQWCLTDMPHRLLKDTLEESWDSDQEARLSAACILERLKSLSPDWRIDAEQADGRPAENTPFLAPSPESQSHVVNIDRVSSNIGE